MVFYNISDCKYLLQQCINKSYRILKLRICYHIKHIVGPFEI